MSILNFVNFQKKIINNIQKIINFALNADVF